MSSAVIFVVRRTGQVAKEEFAVYIFAVPPKHRNLAVVQMGIDAYKCSERLCGFLIANAKSEESKRRWVAINSHRAHAASGAVVAAQGGPSVAKSSLPQPSNQSRSIIASH